MCGVKTRLIAAAQQFIAQPVFHQLAHQAALGMPEDQPRPGFFLNAEKIELRAQPPVIAAFGLFQPMQIFVQLRLREKAGAVDALHLRIAFLPLPVGARHVHQFEGANAARAGDVRPAAEIDEFAGGVKRHHRLDGLFLHQFAFEALVPVLIELDSLRLGKQLALIGHVARRDLVHLFLDAREILRRERLLAQKFVKKSGIDGRADAELHVGKKLQYGCGQQVCRGMPEDLQRFGIL